MVKEEPRNTQRKGALTSVQPVPLAKGSPHGVKIRNGVGVDPIRIPLK